MKKVSLMYTATCACLLLANMVTTPHIAAAAPFQTSADETTGGTSTSEPVTTEPSPVHDDGESPIGKVDTPCSTLEVRCKDLPPHTAGLLRYKYVPRPILRCTVELPASSCVKLGLRDGQSIAPEDLDEIPRPDVIDPEFAANFCTLRHELTHAADPISRRSCESEIKAYNASIDCALSFYRSECTHTANTSGVCASLFRVLENAYFGKTVNQCMCANGTSKWAKAKCQDLCELKFGDRKNCEHFVNGYFK